MSISRGSTSHLVTQAMGSPCRADGNLFRKERNDGKPTQTNVGCMRNQSQLTIGFQNFMHNTDPNTQCCLSKKLIPTQSVWWDQRDDNSMRHWLTLTRYVVVDNKVVILHLSIWIGVSHSLVTTAMETSQLLNRSRRFWHQISQVILLHQSNHSTELTEEQSWLDCQTPDAMFQKDQFRESQTNGLWSTNSSSSLLSQF